MIRSLRGEIEAIGENNVVVLVHGVGFLIHTPTGRNSFTPGDNVFFNTHLVVRENVLDLYGFLEREELSFFELLLTIPKIGPKSALQILTQADINLLSTAISQNDPDHLHKMSGIGKKTAINIVTNLAGKIDQVPGTTVGEATTLGLSSAQVDAIDALITLGYDPHEARSYVTKMNQEDDAKTIIQSVLKQIPIT
jgi:holliday junction DNA helicase RuvA